jgi:hypothetical protein
MKSLQWMSSRRTPPGSRSGVQAAPVDRRSSGRTTVRRAMLLAHLDAWREAADDVEASSRAWRGASSNERSDAALVFFAALEREKTAAFAFQLAWEA